MLRVVIIIIISGQHIRTDEQCKQKELKGMLEIKDTVQKQRMPSVYISVD